MSCITLRLFTDSGHGPANVWTQLGMTAKPRS